MPYLPRNPWPPLLVAIALEVCATLSLRNLAHDAGVVWMIPVVIGYAGALLLLSVVLTRGMAVGIAYGIWSAVGVALTAFLALLAFGETLTSVSTLGIVVVVVGVLMVQLGSHARHSPEPKSAQ